jgi:hypothetical protein
MLRHSKHKRKGLTDAGRSPGASKIAALQNAARIFARNDRLELLKYPQRQQRNIIYRLPLHNPIHMIKQ